ncbi:UNKNOWN [Stylonychia lemnae]|uniref:Thioredoxin n=1 Tax=Stylonychia lemnae TaxID=5949 RepID=A0A078AVR0_STYLE|nr:UNKNOWN [Stylonychia lemnae]|eukprot:CDW86495.1 UNKNOWN [Stylonychia lemnae]
MLKKVVQQTFAKSSQNSLFAALPQRSMLYFNERNYKVPENLSDMVSYLDKARPTFTLLYFTAAWNPVIKKIEKDYERTTGLYKQFDHIRVDCDRTPPVKFYFDARVEPQFLILLNGAELRRVVGFNFERLHSYLDETIDLHRNQLNYIGDTGNTWERFYDNYDRFAKTGDYDKDAFRVHYEGISDTWRGAGTQNP